MGNPNFKVEKVDFRPYLEQLRAWGINDYDLAELTGINRSLLTRYRRGDRDDPPYSKGKAIMAVYEYEKRRQSRKDKAAKLPDTSE